MGLKSIDKRQRLLERSHIGLAVSYVVGCAVLQFAEPQRSSVFEVSLLLLSMSFAFLFTARRKSTAVAGYEFFNFLFCVMVSLHLSYEFISCESKALIPYIVILFLFGAATTFTRLWSLCSFLVLYSLLWTYVSSEFGPRTPAVFHGPVFVAGVYTFAIFALRMGFVKMKVMRQIDESADFFNNLVNSFPQTFLFLNAQNVPELIYGARNLNIEFSNSAPFWEQFHGVARFTVQELVTLARDRSQLAEGEITVAEKLMHLRIFPVEEGELLMLVLDVTALRNQEKAVEADKLKLEGYAQLGEFGAFAGTVAHELNNPLSIAVLNSRLVRKAHAAGRAEIVEAASKNVVISGARILELLQTLESREEESSKQKRIANG